MMMIIIHAENRHNNKIHLHATMKEREFYIRHRSVEVLKSRSQHVRFQCDEFFDFCTFCGVAHLHLVFANCEALELFYGKKCQLLPWFAIAWIACDGNAGKDTNARIRAKCVQQISKE